LCVQEKWNEAEELEVQMLKARQKLLGTDHPDTLLAMADLAATLRLQGKQNEAEELEVQVSKTRERSPETDHSDPLSTLPSLAD
jgi:hypothetical protein